MRRGRAIVQKVQIAQMKRRPTSSQVSPEIGRSAKCQTKRAHGKDEGSVRKVKKWRLRRKKK